MCSLFECKVIFEENGGGGDDYGMYTSSVKSEIVQPVQICNQNSRLSGEC